MFVFFVVFIFNSFFIFICVEKMVNRLTLLASAVIVTVLLLQIFLDFADSAPTYHRNKNKSRAPASRKLNKKEQQAIRALYNRGMLEGDILVRRKPGSKPKPKVSAVDGDRVIIDNRF